jgi:lipopolysaccharide/colanic/teichoic acid biosynthesis glycosyltransferase
MTGLWQVSGRNERTYEEMVRLDIEYVQRQSLGLDLKILLKTIWVVLSGRGVA